MKDISIYPVTLDGDSVEKKRKEIRKYFHNTYDLFESVFEVLKDDEVFYKKSELTRHPMIFYYGHTATFFINKLINMNIIKKRINPNFESMFAVGVDEMHWDDVDSKNYSWADVDEVREYRQRVRELIDDLIMKIPLTLPITQESDMWIILMGIEHERIHIETSLVLHRQMPLEFIKEVDIFKFDETYSDTQKNEMLNISLKDIVLGKEKTHNLYGWDNEYGSYKEKVERFEVSKYLVSNAEFLEFVKDGGYENQEYWDSDGRKFLELSDAKYPLFWFEVDGDYKYRTLTKLVEMPWSFPVEVNALEAEAFCRYKSKKDEKKYLLPSEAEYRCIYDNVGLKDILEFDKTKANQNLQNFSSCSVDKYGFKTKNDDIIYDVIGNVWQWSRTAIFGFDGFKVHPAYDDFSVPTFDNKHSLILGSSWASSGNLIMKHSRYAFRKHFPQFAGFRYVISDAKEKQKEKKLDADVLQNYELQYNSDFTMKCTDIALKYVNKKGKVLDLGCGVGRSSFIFAGEFEKVEGVDISARFIQVGVELLKENSNITFLQGDARNLKPNFNFYDMVIFTNLKERFIEPIKFLKDVKNRMNEKAIFVLVMPKEFKIDNILDDDFNFLHKEDVDSYEVSVWQKK
ncbi:MAG: 5-histidylcysteine sulfoxide synthase [Campylobacterota bacterium]|nr:5-histidylcysteine sulfoxide synthase [Campylobacterota bacterium]